MVEARAGQLAAQESENWLMAWIKRRIPRNHAIEILPWRAAFTESAHLDAPSPQAFTSGMNAMLSADGKLVIPKELRESAQLQPGDTFDIQLYKGTLLLRKHQPLSPEQCAALLERSRSQSKPAPEDDDAVEQAIREVRSARR